MYSWFIRNLNHNHPLECSQPFSLDKKKWDSEDVKKEALGCKNKEPPKEEPVVGLQNPQGSQDSLATIG